MGEISGIQAAIDALVANQLAGQDAMSAHLAAIQAEIAQLGENPTQAQLDHLAGQVNAACSREPQSWRRPARHDGAGEEYGTR